MKAKKHFGQNFLHDAFILQRIADLIHPELNQDFIEIGPGLGALTDFIDKRVQHLTLVEIDRDLVRELKIKYLDDDKVTLIEGDALKFKIKSATDAPIRLVGNLPYNISTPLLFHFFNQLSLITDMHFLLQKEVVLRLCAQPGCKQYGRLSIMAQYYCHCDNLLAVPPTAFHPEPKVDSAVVRLTQKKIEQPAKDVAQLENVVREAFNHRRKTISNGLKNIVTQEQLFELGIDPKARPENLTVAQFVAIANYNSTPLW